MVKWRSIPVDLLEVELRENLDPDGLHYDYDLQSWVARGRVKACGHLETLSPLEAMRARVKGCYACGHAGELVRERRAT